MEDTAALEQFCLLAKSLRGRAVVGIIQQTISSKRVFVFGELLAMPNVQQLRDTEHAPFLKLLEVFAYGTCAEYRATPNMPPLTAVQLAKLRQLSLVTLAKRSAQLTYAELHEELGVISLRELEDIIIETIYMGIIGGKMDQLARVFNVSYTAARDVRLEDIGSMVAKLNQWAATATELSAALSKNKAAAAEKRTKRAERAAALEAKVEEVKKNLKENSAFGTETTPFDVDVERPKRRGKRTRLPPYSRGAHD